ncbi:SUN domain-containing ossification factor isoform X1 [Megalopta genalis]|uniref:SUN domain-containing ossification factor isoform X1 n=1 Tax=Megalopta genalis TaxID=115081 RepID=UPI00144380B6|nr:SUN domain-containing ossification factor isoform X1 [Megalopta genalis]
MKIHVTCVYWTLLFISVASSALLFVIVASENAENNYFSSVKKNESSEIYDNDTLDSIENDTLESSNIPVVKLKNPRKLESNYKEYYQENYPETSLNLETITNSETKRKENPYKNVDIVAESLPQQPNLSHGISGTEQAAVLTLVDTAAAELQSLVEPKFTAEFSRGRIFGKNASLLTKTTKIGQETKKEGIEISTTQIPSTVIEENERLNESNILEEELLSNDEGMSEGVVVVRAEQGPIIIDETEILESEGKILPDEVPKVDKIVTRSPELSDSDAKARLMGHTRDEAPTIVIGEEIVPVASPDPHEDIPSFNEWTQKRLEEAEKKKTHSNASVQNSGMPAQRVGGMKVRSKNYASPDCGAKVVATNPEARSARSVLVSTRDEYMLNTCTSRIWFVVELCEAIQAKKIELANFELFSSTPKDFSVYISDRFPTRDWSLVGQFTAKDVKDIQSFILRPHLFGKFIKVELHTYHGSEHFCPVSLFRAYGTSEFEVLETETENQISRETSTDVDDEEDSDEEEPLDVDVGEPPRNLFGSARDAVLSIVKKAAQVLGKSREFTDKNITTIEQSVNDDGIIEGSLASCTTPRYTILCDNCSAQTFAKVFQLVSCRDHQLNQLLKVSFVNRTLKQSGFCRSYQVDVEAFRRSLSLEAEEITNAVLGQSRKKDLLTSIFKLEYIAALCNMLAIKEGKMVVNTSFIANIATQFNYSKDVSKENMSRKGNENYNESTKPLEGSSTISTSNASTKSASSRDQQKTSQELPNEEPEKFIETPSSPDHIASQMKPTLQKEVKNESSVPTLESGKDNTEEIPPAEMLSTESSPNTGQRTTVKVPEESFAIPGTVIENSPQATGPISVAVNDNNEASHDNTVADAEPTETRGAPNTIEKVERLEQEGKQPEILEQEMKLSSQDSLTLDTLLSDLKDLEGEAVQMQSGSATSASATQSTMNIMPQKESVFLRLSNRIKALERNMSLSGQYLEELSRRYKKQVEEMQRSLERTVAVMNEESRKRDEREMMRAMEITILREEIAALSNSMKNLLYDRNSWRGTFAMIGQYVVILCSQIFVIFLILLYCRSSKKIQSKENQDLKKETLRRKSAENFGTHVKKTKKRRPSEIASHITGTYRELMIDERSHESKKERKRKRKKEAATSGNKTILKSETRPNSIVECPPNSLLYEGSAFETSQQNDGQTCKRPKQVSENTDDWFNNHEVKSAVQVIVPSRYNFETESVKSLEFTTPYINDLSESNSLPVNAFSENVNSGEKTGKMSTDALNLNNSGVILKGTKLSATSFFMKTALSTRKKRKTNSSTVNGDRRRNSSDSTEKSVGTSPTPSISLLENLYSDCDTTANGLSVDQSDESRSSSVVSMSKQKDRKSTGFRKMVRKFF